MKKFMVIIGIVCVVFCGFTMIGCTNNQEQVEQEVVGENYYSDEEIEELKSTLYDYVALQLKGIVGDDSSISGEAFDKWVELMDNNGIEIVFCFDDIDLDTREYTGHYVAKKQLSNGYVVEVDLV